jgi:hypothetical protein
MEISLNTPSVPDGVFKLWIDGLLVKEDSRVLFRYYDDIFIRSIRMRSRGEISLSKFKYWVGECDVPYQYVLIDDVLPGVEVVVLEDIVLPELIVSNYDYGEDEDYVLGNAYEKYQRGFEYDDDVEIFEEWAERGKCCDMTDYIDGGVL